MANLEEYLQAFLDKIADGTETEIPPPDWKHEKYLAAIYEALPSGGGGGGGSGERFVVTFSFDLADGWSADKTFAECVAAWEAGETLVALNSDTSMYTTSVCVCEDCIRFSWTYFDSVVYYDYVLISDDDSVDGGQAVMVTE